MERTKEGLKERIRAGRGKIAAEKVIKGGQLVNVMSGRHRSVQGYDCSSR